MSKILETVFPRSGRKQSGQTKRTCCPHLDGAEVTPVNYTSLPQRRRLIVTDSLIGLHGVVRLRCTRTAGGGSGTIDGVHPRQLTGLDLVKTGVCPD